METDLKTVYPRTATWLPPGFRCAEIEKLPELLLKHHELLRQTPFLADLATVELALHRLSRSPPPLPETVAETIIHPGLELLEVEWKRLPDHLDDPEILPAAEKCLLLLLPGNENRKPRIFTAGNADLLALKIVAEKIDPEEAASEGGVSIAAIESTIAAAVAKGLLLAPPSKIRRPAEFFNDERLYRRFSSSQMFTLQWHLTQKCDLHCRHCYDRSRRAEMSLGQGLGVLESLDEFRRLNNVGVQVSFSGGNPLLYPHFFELYEQTVRRGFQTAILGNTVKPSTLEEIVSIEKPQFFQVSLEGLKDHNDSIRGPGHFDGVVGFLRELRKMNIYSMVMLTLTSGNLKDVLPLADFLGDKVDLFTFNRLAQEGAGADLVPVNPAEYEDFLKDYLAAAARNPCMSLKDSLFNILLQRQGTELKGGCTGYGCGAAFNFLSLLSDGEVHACRKLPSLLGNLFQESLEEIYQSATAAKYRSRSTGCRQCEIHPVCGGCPAVSRGYGLDIFSDVDPYCFKKKDPAVGNGS